MQIDETTYQQMPAHLKALFAKLPNPERKEVLAGFPVTGGGAYKGPSARVRNNGLGLGSEVERSGPSNAPDQYGDAGSAARFFYCAKASRAEREMGLEGMERHFLATMGDGIGAREHNPEEPTAWARNHHPTVKPLSLMRYLVRLTKTPTGGLVLDPFTGSGTTGMACVMEGRDFVGIELSEEYLEIARKRIESVDTQAQLALPLMVEA